MRMIRVSDPRRGVRWVLTAFNVLVIALVTIMAVIVRPATLEVHVPLFFVQVVSVLSIWIVWFRGHRIRWWGKTLLYLTATIVVVKGLGFINSDAPQFVHWLQSRDAWIVALMVVAPLINGLSLRIGVPKQGQSMPGGIAFPAESETQRLTAKPPVRWPSALVGPLSDVARERYRFWQIFINGVIIGIIVAWIRMGWPGELLGVSRLLVGFVSFSMVLFIQDRSEYNLRFMWQFGRGFGHVCAGFLLLMAIVIGLRYMRGYDENLEEQIRFLIEFGGGFITSLYLNSWLAWRQLPPSAFEPVTREELLTAGFESRTPGELRQIDQQ